MKNIVVLMSTYNGEKYLREQIESILKQVGCHVQLLVRDDGSTDNTLNILQEYKTKGKLGIIEGKNLKPAKSFMNLILLAPEAEYYAISDQDDVWKKTKLIRAISMLDKDDKQQMLLYCSNLEAVDEYLNTVQKKLLPQIVNVNYKELLIHSPYLFGCTMVFNKTLCNYIKAEPCPENLIMHDLWIGLICAAHGKIIYDNIPNILYRQHNENHTGASISSKTKWKNRWDYLFGQKKFSISLQAKELLKYLNKKLIQDVDLIEYTEIVASYPLSFRNKIKYLKNIKKGSMNYKQLSFHVILILLGRL